MSDLLTNLQLIEQEKEQKIIPENIKKDITIFGVTGSLTGGLDTSDATALPEDIINPKTAYVNGQKITGSIIATYGINNNIDISYGDKLYRLVLPTELKNFVVFRGTDGSFWLSGNSTEIDQIKYTINGSRINITYIKDGSNTNEKRYSSNDMQNWSLRDKGTDGLIRTNVEIFLYSTGDIYNSEGSVEFEKTVATEYIESLRRNKYLYMDTSNGTGDSSKLLTGYTMYAHDEVIKGAMPNNGELNYDVSNVQQTIPEGYTTGGTIAASPISQQDYDNCLNISNQIIGGVN